jgi:hypothetical protein
MSPNDRTTFFREPIEQLIDLSEDNTFSSFQWWCLTSDPLFAKPLGTPSACGPLSGRIFRKSSDNEVSTVSSMYGEHGILAVYASDVICKLRGPEGGSFTPGHWKWSVGLSEIVSRADSDESTEVIYSDDDKMNSDLGDPMQDVQVLHVEDVKDG